MRRAAYSSIPATGGFFFLSAWLLMIFAGVVAEEVGIEPIGYVTAMVATIGLWLVMVPVVSTVASSVRGRGRRAMPLGMGDRPQGGHGTRGPGGDRGRWLGQFSDEGLDRLASWLRDGAEVVPGLREERSHQA